MKASQEGQGELTTASVYDFLYHDSRRVGSILAQLDRNGLLTEIRQGEVATKKSKRGFSANIGASTPLTGGGNVGFELTPKEGGGESFERVYDPFWANARFLLDTLDEHEMIESDVTRAQLGSIVLFSGSLSIIDLGMIKELWGLPAIQRLIHSGQQSNEPDTLSRHERRSRGKPGKPEVDTNTQLLLEILPTLPHSINAMIGGQNGEAWATLDNQFLVGNGSDLILKHGASIPGQWHMLGILDAAPDFGSLDGIAEGLGAVNAPVISNSLIGTLSGLMAPIVRFLLGRPVEAYGATPLMIFRKVTP